MKPVALDARSLALREDIVCMLEHGQRGHLASAFSLVEILRVLYDEILEFRAAEPPWPKRDRLILSKGHGCMALYALLADKGYFPRDEFKKFCRSDGILGGHPETKVPGVEASTGSLGHGLAIGVGMALAARHDGATHRVFVVVGDGELNEGSVWESALAAQKHRLDQLAVLVDYNKMQSYASTQEVLELEPLVDKWRSFGFAVKEVDGHDVDALRSALDELPFRPRRPSALVCHTIKGRGVSFVEGNLGWHHKSRVKDEEIEALYSELRHPELRTES